MAPENNSNAMPENTSANSDTSAASPPNIPTEPTPDTDVNTPSLSPDTSTTNAATPTVSNPVVSSPSAPSSPAPTVSQLAQTAQVSSSTPQATNKMGKPPKSLIKTLLIVVIALAVLAAVAFASYSMGKSHSKAPVVSSTSAPKPINLPPQAVVTSECTPGRGKQYIIPKDIPNGPIYDVENSKVIAIEYVMGIHALLQNSDNFSSTLLNLAKNYPVDHFSLIPAQPKQGDTDQYIHLIMFVVTKDEANSITCGQASNATTNSTTSSSTKATTSH